MSDRCHSDAKNGNSKRTKQMTSGFARTPTRQLLKLAPRVLLVDDNISVLEALAGLLSSFCDVVTASSAIQAMEAVARQRFDVVVTDWQMPERDGIWLLQHLRVACPVVGRVLLSGMQPPNLGAMVANGLVELFHLKPVRSHQFINSLLRLANAKAAGICGASTPRAA